MMNTCRTCKHYALEVQQCHNEDFVRENLAEVSGMGEMMTDIMIESGACDTFGVDPDYSCEYHE